MTAPVGTSNASAAPAAPARPAASVETTLIQTPKSFDRGDLVYVAYLLLPFRLFVQLGSVLGWIEMLVRPRARRAVRANIEQAFGTTKSAREKDALTRQVFEFHQMRVLLVLVAPLLAADGSLAKYFPLKDIEHLDRAVAAGKGVLIIGSHVNSVGGLLAMVRLRQLGYDVRVPMPDRNDAWPPTVFRRLVHRWTGAKSFSELTGAFYAQFNVRPLMKVLEQGSILLLMADGWHSASFVDADFLGRRLPFTNAPMNFARLAGVSVVTFFSVGPPDHMHFAFEPAFTVERTTPPNLDVERKVRHFVSRVEERMLADIPCWQHWMVEDVFGSLERWRDKPISERYAV